MFNISRNNLNNTRSIISFLFLFISIIFPTTILKANEILPEELRSEYLLGPSDQIFINFRGLDFFGGFYTANANGVIILPEIGKINISKMTIKELENYLEARYENTIYNPEIDITISKYRPVSFYITGEVKRPGLYRFDYSNKTAFQDLPATPLLDPSGRNSINNLTKGIEDNYVYLPSKTPFIIPKLFDALQRAKGVTNKADLSSIRVIRMNSNSQGGGQIQTVVNFLELLKTGDQSQNLRIYDGDSIIVEKSENPLKEQILLASNSNITPNEISVFINGNVVSSGTAILPKGSSLVQAIASAGGKKLFTGNIEFIRFSGDGKTIKNVFRYNPMAPINTKRNPILMDGDIIFVRKTILGKGTEMINEIATPVLSGYGLYSIFED